MKRKEDILVLSGSIIGAALVLVPSMLMWPMSVRLGVGGSVAFVVVGMLCMAASATLFASWSVLVRAIIIGIGGGIFSVGVMNAMHVHLVVRGLTS